LSTFVPLGTENPLKKVLSLYSTIIDFVREKAIKSTCNALRNTDTVQSSVEKLNNMP
jgi:hypothetical protein